MTKSAHGLLLIALLGSDPVGGAQLPPQVLLDQLLLRTERLLEADDLDGAVEAMEEASALAAEHELALPPDFRFEQGRTEFAVGLLGAAKESVTAYLAVASRAAESYLDAVGLLEDVDRILERRDAPECAPEPDGSACWMELTSHPGCYTWNFDPQPDETATWTGECSAGFAQGPGTLTWTYSEGSREHEASRRFGQPHGPSVVRDSEGWVDEGSHRFGKRHGAWIERATDGAVLEGPYVDGERNGRWVLRFASGQIEEGPYEDGEKNGHWVMRFPSGAVHEGPMVNGQRHGAWIERTADGGVHEGPMVNGQRHGAWIERTADGGVLEGPYVDGKENGHWVLRFTDARGTQEGPYMDGKMHGHWVQRFANSNVGEGPYVNGQRSGRWIWRFPSGQVEEGPYVNGQRSGRWNWRFPSGQVEEGPYVDDERHGRWVVHPPDGDTYYVTFVRGVRQER